MDDWHLVKTRTATQGAVWVSGDGALFRRTGGPEVEAEARSQIALAEQGYPVPGIVEVGRTGAEYFFVERGLGPRSLHDEALRDVQETGAVRESSLGAMAEISCRLLRAQVTGSTEGPVPEGGWEYRAGFVDNVFAENPDLDTARARAGLRAVAERARGLPRAPGHLDYGLPNAFRGGVIDWQHSALVPVGFDVYTMLDITAFKGGRGYAFSTEQRARYTAALDGEAERLLGAPLSGYLGDFLLVKCFFFLALLRPEDQNDLRRLAKWEYRRFLFSLGLASYERSRSIDTGTFPDFPSFLADRDMNRPVP